MPFSKDELEVSSESLRGFRGSGGTCWELSGSGKGKGVLGEWATELESLSLWSLGVCVVCGYCAGLCVCDRGTELGSRWQAKHKELQAEALAEFKRCCIGTGETPRQTSTPRQTETQTHRGRRRQRHRRGYRHRETDTQTGAGSWEGEERDRSE
eukprot:3316393-Rhodomonas_salina.1